MNVQVAHFMGHECVRGSTYRGGAAALAELARKGRDMHIAITPDGPRGPRRQLAQGPIFLASRLGLPIVALGFGISTAEAAVEAAGAGAQGVIVGSKLMQIVADGGPEAAGAWLRDLRAALDGETGTGG